MLENLYLPQIIYNKKLTDIRWPTKNVQPSNRDPYYNADDATMRALRQSLVLTPAMKVAVDPSVEQSPTNFTYVMKSTNAYV
jgi:hypothetical protein